MIYLFIFAKIAYMMIVRIKSCPCIILSFHPFVSMLTIISRQMEKKKKKKNMKKKKS